LVVLYLNCNLKTLLDFLVLVEKKIKVVIIYIFLKRKELVKGEKAIFNGAIFFTDFI